MDTILVFEGNMPCLNKVGGAGICRDRNPDGPGDGIRAIVLTRAKEVPLTPELKKYY